MNRDEVEVYEIGKKKKTNTRLISNHHDRTSLVNNGFITRQPLWTKLVQSSWLIRSWRRYDSWILDIGRVLFFPHLFALSRIKWLVYFKSQERKQLCLWHNTSRESFMFSLFWLFSATFCDFIADIVQELRTL